MFKQLEKNNVKFFYDLSVSYRYQIDDRDITVLNRHMYHHLLEQLNDRILVVPPP